MKYIFIVNPISGNDNKAEIFARIKSAFRLIDDEMIIEKTDHPGHAKEIAQHYSSEYGEKCVIVSCGGDGTVHEIANGLAGTETPLMIIPLGMGNDFAKKIYGTKKINVDNVIKSFGLHNGKIKYDVKPIDLIDYNGEKCINVMSFGLDTKVETLGRKIAAKAPMLGHQAYNVAIIPIMCKPMRYNINVDLDCIDVNGNTYKIKDEPLVFTLFAICNASYYGGGFCPAPNSKLDDGILDFAMVDTVTIPQAIPLIPMYSAGVAAENSNMVHDGQVIGGHIWSYNGEPLLGNADGENFDYQDLTFKVEKHALKLCFIKD